MKTDTDRPTRISVQCIAFNESVVGIQQRLNLCHFNQRLSYSRVTWDDCLPLMIRVDQLYYALYEEISYVG